ncbi:MAG: type II secretion system F family protein [Planctomycetaceae bacterium]
METTNLVSLISFASIVSGCGAVFLGVRDLFSRRSRDTALNRELRRLPKVHDVAPSGLMERFDCWLEQTLYMSGLNMTPLEGVLLATLVTLTGGGVIFLATENELLTLMTAMILVTFVFISLVIIARRRTAKFELQFPMALDLLARAVRAGESFDQSLVLVGEASEEPVGSELKRCARQLELGLSMQNCMQGMAQRVNLMDVRIFANAVAVHRESGGNLSVTLERLAEVVRDRQSYHRQLRSVTGAGRLSSMLITALGPILFIYLFVFQNEYGRRLVEDPMGKWMLLIAVICQLTGIIWVLRLLKSDF